MNQPGSIAVPLTTAPPENAQAKRPSVSWIFCGALMVIAVAMMLADAALTPEQRSAVFTQAGHFP